MNTTEMLSYYAEQGNEKAIQILRDIEAMEKKFDEDMAESARVHLQALADVIQKPDVMDGFRKEVPERIITIGNDLAKVYSIARGDYYETETDDVQVGA